MKYVGGKVNICGDGRSPNTFALLTRSTKAFDQRLEPADVVLGVAGRVSWYTAGFLGILYGIL